MDLKEVFLKLDRQSSDIADVRVNIAKAVVMLDRNTTDIQRHIQRTDELQHQVDLLKQHMNGSEARFRGALWAASAIFGTFLALIPAAAKLISVLASYLSIKF